MLSSIAFVPRAGMALNSKSSLVGCHGCPCSGPGASGPHAQGSLLTSGYSQFGLGSVAPDSDT